jgi:hypothetical protein
VVKPERRIIVLVNFQKYGTRAKAGQPAQMQIEQLARKAPPALAAGNRNGEDFRLILDHPRHDEARKLSAYQGAVCDDVPVQQQTLDLLFAPATPE